MIKNYMEIVVDDVLESMLKERKISCVCQKCTEDIKAITLNNLKPIYIVSDKGLLYSKLNEFNNQFRADVISQIIAAIKRVEECPSHDGELIWS